MTQPLTDPVERLCSFRRKQRGKTEGGVQIYRWPLEQFSIFIRDRHGRLARITDLAPVTIQARMDDMAGVDLALSTVRTRHSTLSSFCAWLVKRDMLAANPVAKLERPPPRREPPSFYTTIRPQQLKRAVSIYEERATKMLGRVRRGRRFMFEELFNVPQIRSQNASEIHLVAPTGARTHEIQVRDFLGR